MTYDLDITGYGVSDQLDGSNKEAAGHQEAHGHLEHEMVALCQGKVGSLFIDNKFGHLVMQPEDHCVC